MTAEAATRDAASAHDAQATQDEAAATQIVTGLAQAARRLGLNKVPLLCAREVPVPGAMPRVIRTLLHYYAPEDHEPRHVYLGTTRTLRADLEAGLFEPGCPLCRRPLEPGVVPEDAPLDPRNVYADTKLAQEHLAASWAQ